MNNFKINSCRRVLISYNEIMWRKIQILFLITFLFLITSNKVLAADFKSDYQVEYFLGKTDNITTAKVIFTINITNLNSDVYVKKFSIAFPKNYLISQITAADNKGVVNPNVVNDGEKILLNLEFNDPAIGRDTTNSFHLAFLQEKIFDVSGNIWELIIPTLENQTSASGYRAIVYLPENSDRKISIAKPRPSLIQGNKIIWENPQVKTIYAVFGDEQYYQSKFTYHLYNPKLVPVYTDVALPPDTDYQKIFVNQLNPLPSQVFLDEDGNYMARYNLFPKSKVDIILSADISLSTKRREEYRILNNYLMEKQKSFLLSPQPLWQIEKVDKLPPLLQVQDIYKYVTNSLSYNYERVGKNEERRGAEKALLNPEDAVCTEFSDLFVALAREKGIYSREIQGYGFTRDDQLRPISLTSDILHSWPEYYQEVNAQWISVDPTWENTSGIDYYNSFDLNHIVLAIHGKSAEYPYSAGMYKINKSQDIVINPVSLPFREIGEIEVDMGKIESQINDKKTYQTTITITNNKNVYVYNIRPDIRATNLNVSLNPTVIVAMVPMEKKTFVLNYQVDPKHQNNEGFIKVSMNNHNYLDEKVKIITYAQDMGFKVGIIVIGGSIIFFFIKRLFKKK